MSSIRDQFPIFSNHHNLVYLDSASSTQKPKYVIDKTSEYIATSYANIGRWSYFLADRSDYFYYSCKEKIGKLINALPQEIFFWHNSSHCINSIGHSLAQSWYFKPWWEIIIGIAEHHSNILIWQQFAKQYSLTIRRVWLTKEHTIDTDELRLLVNTNTCLTCLTACSNVLGIKNDISIIRSIIGHTCFFLLDASQAIPHYSIDIQSLDVDGMVFSGHKFLAYTWVGVGYIKQSLIKKLKPWLVWWGTVEDVDYKEGLFKWSIDKFEVWTPNIIGIVSLYYALERWEQYWWYIQREKEEKNLLSYTLNQCLSLSDTLTMTYQWEKDRIGIITFTPNKDVSLPWLYEFLNKHTICVRSGWHCAYPLAKYLWLHKGTIRLSLYVYNTTNDIDIFVSKVKAYKKNT